MRELQLFLLHQPQQVIKQLVLLRSLYKSFREAWLVIRRWFAIMISNALLDTSREELTPMTQ